MSGCLVFVTSIFHHRYRFLFLSYFFWRIIQTFDAWLYNNHLNVYLSTVKGVLVYYQTCTCRPSDVYLSTIRRVLVDHQMSTCLLSDVYLSTSDVYLSTSDVYLSTIRCLLVYYQTCTCRPSDVYLSTIRCLLVDHQTCTCQPSNVYLSTIRGIVAQSSMIRESRWCN